MNNLKALQFIEKNWLNFSVIILASITILSLTPIQQLPSVPGSDKTHHFISYALLFFPVALARPKHWLFIGLFFAIFSGIIELIQPYVNRYGEWMDLLANCIGLFCGFIMAWLISKYFADKF